MKPLLWLTVWVCGVTLSKASQELILVSFSSCDVVLFCPSRGFSQLPYVNLLDISISLKSVLVTTARGNLKLEPFHNNLAVTP